MWGQREENVLQRQLRAKVWGMQGTDQKQNGYKSWKTEWRQNRLTGWSQLKTNTFRNRTFLWGPYFYIRLMRITRIPLFSVWGSAHPTFTITHTRTLPETLKLLSLYKFKGQGQSHCFKDVEVESIQKLEVNYISIKNLMKVYNKPISFQSPAFKHWIESGKILVLGFFSPLLGFKEPERKTVEQNSRHFPYCFF